MTAAAILRSLAVLAAAAAAGAAEYFVAPTGSDANPGTAALPWRTIAKACSTNPLVLKPGDIVTIRGGTYRETLVPPTSGQSGAPITFRAYAGETVTLDGADLVGGWTRDPANASRWYASMAWTMSSSDEMCDQVFINGQMINHARWPATGLDQLHPTQGSIDSIAAVSMGAYGQASSCTFHDAALTQPAGHWVGAAIHINPGTGAWYAQTGTVTANDGAGNLTFSFKAGVGSSNLQTPVAGNPYYLIGKLAEVAGPNQWWLDRSAGRLTVWAPNGDTPANYTVEAKRRAWAIDLGGRSWITVQGVRVFAASTRTDANSSNDTLDGIDAEYVAQYLTNTMGYDNDGAYGLILAGSHNRLINSKVTYSAGCGVVLSGSSNTIDHSTVSEVGWGAYNDACVDVIGDHGTVSWCSLFDSGRFLVHHQSNRSTGNGTGTPTNTSTGYHQIVHNDMHHAGLLTKDFGATYCYNTDGRGTVIAYNRIHDIRSGMAAGTGYDQQYGDGIYLDSFSSNFVVHHNCVWNCGAAGIQVNWTTSAEPSNTEIYDNTFWDVMAGGIGGAANPPADGFYNVKFWNNLYNAGLWSQFANGVNQSNDLLAAAGSDASYFVNVASSGGLVTTANPDFGLRAGSPAIDQGRTITTTDSYISPAINVTAGSAGAAPDCGAFENGAAEWTAGAGSTTPPPPSGGEQPYGGAPASLPGTVQCENYDLGGEGVAYHDLDAANQGGAYRTDGVDIQACGEGGYNVGWTYAGEWLAYTVNVAAAGYYDLRLRVATIETGAVVHVEFNGANVTGPIDIPATGGWQTYRTLVRPHVWLNAGQQVMRLAMDTNGSSSSGAAVGNFTWISVSAAQQPYGGAPASLPGTVQCENYDLGGEGVAYHDFDNANQGGTYRTDGVDLEACAEGGYNVGWTRAGEWLDYTVNATAEANYSLAVRASSLLSGGAFHLEVDGVNVSGALATPNTGAWQTYRTVTGPVVHLRAGWHRIRLALDTEAAGNGYFSVGNYTWIQATQTTAPAIAFAAVDEVVTAAAPATAAEPEGSRSRCGLGTGVALLVGLALAGRGRRRGR